MPKFVATVTLTSLEWNAVALEGDVVAAVRALKAQPGGNILTYGSGKRLFAGGGKLPLQLEFSENLGAGVLLTHRPATAT